MPAYQYEATDTRGKTSKGVLDADSVKSARTQLRAKKLIPLSVKAITDKSAVGKGLKRELWARPTFSSTLLTVWTRQLAGLTGSGLTLERALYVLTQEAPNEKVRYLITNIRSEVNAGVPFAKALSDHPREFSSVYRAVIACGEQSGQLDQVLLSLAEDLENQQNLKNKLIGAALYPCIVSVIAIVMVFFLMSYVVPQIAQVFTGKDQELPLLTSIMLSISDFVQAYGWHLVITLVVVLFLFKQSLKLKKIRLYWDSLILRLPILGNIIRNYHTTRFTATLSLLTGAGVPILKALQTAAETLGNAALRADALDALVLVREGSPLSTAIGGQKHFPSLLPMFTRLGEQTGQLPTMLARAATQIGNEVQRRALAIATILEPTLIVGMGLMVMLIVLAVLMPIIEMNQLVG
jgi:general secretion pathway protein F